MNVQSVAASEQERLALDAEDRVQSAPTQGEREYWERMADYWWNLVPQGEES